MKIISGDETAYHLCLIQGIIEELRGQDNSVDLGVRVLMFQSRFDIILVVSGSILGEILRLRNGG
jgi:hypothetical protein